MSEKEIKKTKKIKWKKILMIICIVFVVLGGLYHFGKMLRHYLWKNSLRYEGNVGCLISNPKCFSKNISKEDFIKEMKFLEISKEEAVRKLKETKKNGVQYVLSINGIQMKCLDILITFYSILTKFQIN